MTFPKLKRLKKITDILNENSERFITLKELLITLNRRIDDKICASSLDKDINSLKNDFDMEIESSSLKFVGGIKLTQKIDFFEQLKRYIE